MVAIANMQYGWTLFVGPIQDKFGWEKAAIQVAFTLFVLFETWPVPLEGYLVDRFGPRLMVLLGGVLVGAAWILNAHADSLVMLYLGGAIGGIGAGIVYGTSMGSALKWFPHRRGLAAGLTSAAFGAGSALTVLPISYLINNEGYESAFFWFGIIQGSVVLVCGLLLRTPQLDTPAAVPAAAITQSGRDFRFLEMVRTPLFWLIYLMFAMVCMGGLMITAQISDMAKVEFGVAKKPIYFGSAMIEALPLALALDRVLNGLTRPFFGWVSDRVGRENTMFIAFTLEGLAILLLVQFAHDPVLFVLLTGLTFFAWGEIYSLFPALCSDVYGRKFATTNYGFLYTAKGTAALLVPLGNIIQKASGTWMTVLLAAAILDLITALLALFVLKGWVRRFVGRQGRQRSTEACA
jgi:OFA family oxalate/formate antiporter-like MFS transporter